MPVKSFTLPSFAKINLHLRVLGKRADGYHELCTVFQTVSLKDDITFTESDELALISSDPNVPTDERNLILKAARLLSQFCGVSKGAKIRLEKRVPAPGGLGGGSSNAAVALFGLAELWQVPVTPEQLFAMAEKLGSDVPFFLHGGTALGTGRGTDVTPVDDIPGASLLIVTPDCQVPTAQAFARLGAPNLTNKNSKSILQICRQEAQALYLRQSEPINDFESSVFEFEPEIKRVRDTLLELGAARAMMSGSGASVFGIFDKEETRQATLKALEKESNWRKFAVATISRSAYREALKECKGLFPISF